MAKLDILIGLGDIEEGDLNSTFQGKLETVHIPTIFPRVCLNHDIDVPEEENRPGVVLTIEQEGNRHKRPMALVQLSLNESRELARILNTFFIHDTL